MTPSVTLSQLKPEDSKARESRNAITKPLIHVHGGEELTPLEALSHGPLVLGGKL